MSDFWCGQDISTHALREEGDVIDFDIPGDDGKFLPTPSARRATQVPQQLYLLCMISTHALREEGDMLETK